MRVIAALITFMLVAGASRMLAAAPTHPQRLAFDTERSKITVHVGKRGIFAFAADNHEIVAPIASGSFDPATLGVEFTIATRAMRVVDSGMNPDRRAQVQSNMSGPQVLDTATYPEIVFHSTLTRVVSDKHLIVVGDLTLHGATRAVTVDVTKLDRGHFSGSATIRQTDFGIRPIRIAGGTVQVRDDLAIDFDVQVK